MSNPADEVIEAIRRGQWATADLVRLAHAVARRGKNTTSILGQYGEDLVARAYSGVVASFDQKAYDVRTPHDGDLQVKTYSIGKRPGAIRSFTHDVVTVEIDPTTANVVSAKRYAAADLYAAFSELFEAKLRAMGMTWRGGQGDRFERGWTIPTGLPFEDVTARFIDLGRR